jgi:hypothetical protein
MKFNSPDEASAAREMKAGAARAPAPAAVTFNKVRRLTDVVNLFKPILPFSQR